MTTEMRSKAEAQVSRLHRLTVNLTEKAQEALDLVASQTGRSKTDTVNRALIVNAWIEQVTRDGGSIYVEEKPGELQKVKIL